MLNRPPTKPLIGALYGEGDEHYYHAAWQVIAADYLDPAGEPAVMLARILECGHSGERRPVPLAEFGERYFRVRRVSGFERF